jgi:hypothetical protein
VAENVQSDKIEYPYEELEGEREFFVHLCGGELEYRLWCYEVLYGKDALLQLLKK